MDEAVSGALLAGRNRPAFALLLEGEGQAGSGDATAVLARSLARADLSGFTPGPELAAA